MSVNHLVRMITVAISFAIVGLSERTSAAGPLVAQPQLSQAIVPAAVGFHRFRGGFGHYRSRGWGSYDYGRPSLYFGYGGYGYRPYRSVVRYNYRPAYYRNYGYSNYYSPYSTNAYVSYRPVTYVRPITYASAPVVYSSPVVYQQPAYSAPVVYSAGVTINPVYANPVYPPGIYTVPVSYPAYSAGYTPFAPGYVVNNCGVW